MKSKSIFAASLLVAGVAFADSTEVATDFVLGVMPFNFAANQAEAVVSIPWVAAGSNNTTPTDVAVKDVIKTANLNPGDMLYWYDSSAKNFKYWRLTSGGEGNPSYWKPVPNPSSEEESSDSTTLARGGALLVKRNSDTSNAVTIYILGQHTTATPSTITIPAGTRASPSFTLLASPIESGTADLVTKFSSAAPGDAIIFADSSGNLKTYTWGLNTSTKEYCWGRGSVSNGVYSFGVDSAATDIGEFPAGKGFWYKRCGDSFNVNW